MRTENKQYLTYAAKYLGVALIAGSIVHIGTLDSGTIRYLVLAAIGLVMMLAGNIVEALQKNQSIDAKYFVNVIGLSFATGFLSGGAQHYLDNPLYAGYLLGIGLLVSYVTFFRKDNQVLSLRDVALVGACSLFLLLSGHLVTSGILGAIHLDGNESHGH